MNQGEDVEGRSASPVMSLLAAVMSDGSLGGAACRAQLPARAGLLIWLALRLLPRGKRSFVLEAAVLSAAPLQQQLEQISC